MPVILPPIEARTSASRGPSLRRLGLVASMLTLSPGTAAVAAGISLVAAGTTASVYLWRGSSGGHPTHSAVSNQPVAAAPNQIARPPAVREPRSTPPTRVAPAPAPTRPRGVRRTVKKHTQPVKHEPVVRAEEQEAAVVVHPSSARAVPTAPATTSQVVSAKPAHRSTAPRSERPAPHVPRTKPHAPRPEPPATPTPPPQAPPSGGSGTTPTGNTPQEPQPSPQPTTPSPPETPPVIPPPSTTPTPTPPGPTPPTSEAPQPERPGNGWGDKNHDHTGPPGQDPSGDNDDGHGNGHGNGHG